MKLTRFFNRNEVTIEEVERIIAPPTGEREGILILSGACCHPGKSLADEKIKVVLTKVEEKINRKLNILYLTIAEANELLKKSGERFNSLGAEVSKLFSNIGINMFPTIIIDSEIAFYGNIPTEDEIITKLKKRKKN